MRLVIAAAARDVIPYLADAVPGWLQACMTLYDATGEVIMYVDDWRFRPDPVIIYKVEKDGEYRLEVKDTLFRGREDLVYLIFIACAIGQGFKNDFRFKVFGFVFYGIYDIGEDFVHIDILGFELNCSDP